MQWTAESIDLLRELWAAGETAAAIGDRLGGMSRSAVLGKVFRLRLDAAGAGKKVRKQRRSAPPQSAGAAQIARRRRSPKRSQQVPPLNAATRGKTLLELSNNTCRWPHGRPGTEKFHFCGVPEANLERGMPYCATHMRRAYPMFADALTDLRPAPKRHLDRAR